MPMCEFRSARSHWRRSPASRLSASTTHPAPTRMPPLAIDVEKGLPRLREAWVKERGGIEQYNGRDIKPEDNGNVTGAHLARDFPNKTAPFAPIPASR